MSMDDPGPSIIDPAIDCLNRSVHRLKLIAAQHQGRAAYPPGRVGELSESSPGSPRRAFGAACLRPDTASDIEGYRGSLRVARYTSDRTDR